MGLSDARSYVFYYGCYCGFFIFGGWMRYNSAFSLSYTGVYDGLSYCFWGSIAYYNFFIYLYT